jgi:hypothetical protein
MAVERSSLEFFIKTTYDGAGVKQANADLQQATTATRSAGDAAKKIVPDLDEHAKHAEKLGLKHLELKKVLNELSREFPIMGEAAKLALEPEVTIALSVVAAFAFLKNQYEETQEALRGGDWSTPISQLAAVDKTASDSAESLAEFGRSLDAIAHAQKSIQEETNKAIASLIAEAEETKKLSDAKFALAKAELEAAAAAGKISPEEKERRSGALENKKLEDDANARLKLLQDQLQKLQKAKADYDAALGEGNPDEQIIKKGAAEELGDQEQVNKITGRVKRDETALGVDADGNAVDKNGKIITKDSEGNLSGERTGELGKLDELNKELADLKHQLAEGGPRTGSNQNVYDAQVKKIEEAQAAVEQQSLIVASAKKLIDQEREKLIAIPTQIKKIEETVDAAKKRQTEAENSRKDLIDNKIPQIEEQIRLLQKEINEVLPVQKRANAVTTQTRVNEIQKDEKAKRDREEQQERDRIERSHEGGRGGKSVSDAGSTLNKISGSITGLSDPAKEAAEALLAKIQNQTAADQQWKNNFARRVALLESRTGNRA